MKTRQQAAEEWYNELVEIDEDDNFNLKDAFLAGCEHVDKEHRDFYLLVRELFQLYDSRYSETTGDPFTAAAKAEKVKVRIIMLEKEIKKHLAAFTEREQTSLPFKD